MGQDCIGPTVLRLADLGSLSRGMLVGPAWAVASSNRRFSHVDSDIDRPLTSEAIQGRFPRGGLWGTFIFSKTFLFINLTYIRCLK